jgi:hypothetical protein
MGKRDISRVILAALVLISGTLACDSVGEYEIAQIKVSPRWTIEILASREVDVFQSIYYRVRVDDEVVVLTSRICSGYANRAHQFQIITAKEGTLVGVYEARYPDEILALHDFNNNETWPAAPTRTRDENEKVRQELLDQLQKEHPNLNLNTGRGSGCA